MIRAARNDIFTAVLTRALTAQLDTPLQFVRSGQKLLDWERVGSGSQPALFLNRTLQHETQSTQGIAQLKLTCQLWIYFRTEGSTEDDLYPGQIIDAYLDAMEKAFEPDIEGERLTLGLPGVSHCWIDGTIAFSDGVEDQQGVILIPITVMCGI